MNGNRLSIIGASLVIVAIVVLGWLLGVAPKLTEADVALAEQLSVDEQNAAQEVALVALRNQFGDLDTLRSDYAALQEEIPSAPKVEDFLDELKAAADLTGVTLVAVTAAETEGYAGAAVDSAAPSTETADPADAADAADPSLGTQPDAGLAGQLFTVGVSITVTGTSAQVLDFTGTVQEGTRFFLANMVSFTGTASESSGGSISGYLFVVRGREGAITAAE